MTKKTKLTKQQLIELIRSLFPIVPLPEEDESIEYIDYSHLLGSPGYPNQVIRIWNMFDGLKYVLEYSCCPDTEPMLCLSLFDLKNGKCIDSNIVDVSSETVKAILGICS